MDPYCSCSVVRPGSSAEVAARFLKRLPILGLPILLALAFVAAAIPAHAQGTTDPKHFFWAPGQPSTPNPSSLQNDLIYHGGDAGPGAIGVENKPATYLILWGPDWENGFTTVDKNGQVFTSQELQPTSLRS